MQWRFVMRRVAVAAACACSVAGCAPLIATRMVECASWIQRCALCRPLTECRSDARELGCEL